MALPPKEAPPPFVMPSDEAPRAAPPEGAPRFEIPGAKPGDPPEPPPAGPPPGEPGRTFPMPNEFGLTPPAEIQTTADPKYEDYPTLTHVPADLIKNPGQWLALRYGLAFPGTVEGRTNILQKHLPGATFENDKYGNPLVVHEGKKYHIDRPDTFNDQNIVFGATEALPTIAPTAALAAVPGAGPALATAELFSAGYLGHQLRTWLGREAGSGAEQDLLNPAAFMEGVINLLPGAGTALKNVGSGVKKGLSKVLEKREGLEEALNRLHPDDQYYHVMPDNVADLIRKRPFSQFAEQVEKSAAAHIEAAPVRVAQGLDQTFGPADASIKAAIQTAKGPASADLTTALNQARPIDIAPLIARIDKALAETTPEMPSAKALVKFKKMLTEQGATPGTGFTREAVPGTMPGRPAIYRQVPGQPGTPAQYVSDPAMLNTIKREFDNVLKFGDSDIAPRSVSATDHAIQGVRQDLSNMLNTSVPGYEQIMTRYRTAYDMSDAYDVGQNIMKGGNKALKLEDILPYLQNNPAEAEGFRMGVRDAIDNVIRTAADGKDVAAVKKILGGDGRREILTEMYGKEPIDNLVALAERETKYAGDDQLMLTARQQGRRMSQITAAENLDAPVLKPLPAAANLGTMGWNKFTEGVNWLGRRLTGRDGPKFDKELGDLLTSNAESTIKNLLGQSKVPHKAGPNLSSTLPAPIVEGFQPDRRTPYKFARGGRAQLDCVGRAAKLCREADAIRRKHAGQTKVILHAPDDAVATALAIAGRGV